jgi:phage terminase small subunit
MSDKELELNDTQLLWANEYLSNGMNKTEAARVAYPNADRHAEIGAENYRKPHIKEYIQERVMSLIQGKGELTSKLIDKWCEVAFYEFNGETENPKWKTQDILKATDQLSKYLGLNVEKVEHSGGQTLTIKREIVKPSGS